MHSGLQDLGLSRRGYQALSIQIKTQTRIQGCGRPYRSILRPKQESTQGSGRPYRSILPPKQESIQGSGKPNFACPGTGQIYPKGSRYCPFKDSWLRRLFQVWLVEPESLNGEYKDPLGIMCSDARGSKDL